MELVDLQKFCATFSPCDNALQMRTLRRWNGRDLRDEENLAEHTHLVVVCVFEVMNMLRKTSIKLDVSVLDIIEHALYHDSLEMLRGDILSLTKDTIPGLRKQTDDEEHIFMDTVCNGKLTDDENDVLVLADLMACYKFIEWELRYPSNEFAKIAYNQTKTKFDNYYNAFLEKHGERIKDTYCPEYRFIKGYKDDAGVDIILNEDVVFMPMSTTTVDLNVQITPKLNHMAFLCARTSAAAQGLSIAPCPIDPNYTGNVTAIVHNVSNNIITYKAGEAFCQYVMFKINTAKDVCCRKKGKRTTSKLGGTGK